MWFKKGFKYFLLTRVVKVDGDKPSTNYLLFKSSHAAHSDALLHEPRWWADLQQWNRVDLLSGFQVNFAE